MKTHNEVTDASVSTKEKGWDENINGTDVILADWQWILEGGKEADGRWTPIVPEHVGNIAHEVLREGFKLRRPTNPEKAPSVSDATDSGLASVKPKEGGIMLEQHGLIGGYSMAREFGKDDEYVRQLEISLEHLRKTYASEVSSLRAQIRELKLFLRDLFVIMDDYVETDVTISDPLIGRLVTLSAHAIRKFPDLVEKEAAITNTSPEPIIDGNAAQ